MTTDNNDIRSEETEHPELYCHRKLVNFMLAWSERRAPVAGEWLQTLDADAFQLLYGRLMHVLEDEECANPEVINDVAGVLHLLLICEGIQFHATDENTEKLGRYYMQLLGLCVLEAERRAGRIKLLSRLSLTRTHVVSPMEDTPGAKPPPYH